MPPGASCSGRTLFDKNSKVCSIYIGLILVSDIDKKPIEEREDIMSFKCLIDTLRRMPEKELHETGKELVLDTVLIPSGTETADAEIHKAIWRKPEGINLRIDATIPMNMEQFGPVVCEFFDHLRKQTFTPGMYEVGAECKWQGEDFLKEVSLGSTSRLRISGSFYTHNPKKVRIGGNYRSQEIVLECEGRKLTITASEGYRYLLPTMINAIKPQFAIVRLSPEDANRLLAKAKGPIWRRRLKRALVPKKRTYMKLGVGSFGFETAEEIEITIPTAFLEKFAEGIGKSLLLGGTEGGSYVVSLAKFFWRGSSVLPTLQKAVRLISEFRTETLFDHPLLTEAQAKELLEKEIDLISKSYENFLFFGVGTRRLRTPVARQLASEHFGEGILSDLDGMDLPRFLDHLKSLGYLDNVVEKEMHEHEGTVKERHLFRFFEQSYAKDPRNSIELFRRWYVNPAPTVSITGRVSHLDASLTSKISLPSRASLIEVGLKQCDRQGDNELVVEHRIDNAKIWLRISLDSGNLIDLQEEYCRKLGITFP